MNQPPLPALGPMPMVQSILEEVCRVQKTGAATPHFMTGSRELSQRVVRPRFAQMLYRCITVLRSGQALDRLPTSTLRLVSPGGTADD